MGTKHLDGIRIRTRGLIDRSGATSKTITRSQPSCCLHDHDEPSRTLCLDHLHRAEAAQPTESKCLSVKCSLPLQRKVMLNLRTAASWFPSYFTNALVSRAPWSRGTVFHSSARRSVKTDPIDTLHLEPVMDPGHSVSRTVPIYQGYVMFYTSPTKPLRLELVVSRCVHIAITLKPCCFNHIDKSRCSPRVIRSIFTQYTSESETVSASEHILSAYLIFDHQLVKFNKQRKTHIHEHGTDDRKIFFFRTDCRKVFMRIRSI